MNKHTLVYTEQELPFVAQTLHGLLGHCAIIAVTGSLGAGKTALTQALFRYVGIEDDIQSPTFNYVSIYTAPSGWRYYHFDLYRLTSMREFMELGFHEYLYEPQSYAIIEWPEIIMPLLKHRVCFVDIDYVSENARRLWYYCLE